MAKNPNWDGMQVAPVLVKGKPVRSKPSDVKTRHLTMASWKRNATKTAGKK